MLFRTAGVRQVSRQILLFWELRARHFRLKSSILKKKKTPIKSLIDIINALDNLPIFSSYQYYRSRNIVILPLVSSPGRRGGPGLVSQFSLYCSQSSYKTATFSQYNARFYTGMLCVFDFCNVPIYFRKMAAPFSVLRDAHDVVSREIFL